MPSYKLLSIYGDRTSACFELSEIKWGDFGNKVFWRIWHVNDPRRWFHYRLVPDGYEPIVFEQDVLVRTGSDCQVFPPPGRRVYFTGEFIRNALRFRGMKLDKQTTDPGPILQVEQTLEHAAHKM